MILAQVTNTDTTTYNEALSGAAGGAIAGLFIFLIILGVALEIICLAGMWKTASKAGQVGILACIPIVQIFIAMLIAKKPLWWVLLCLVPIVNFIVLLIVVHEISKRFGRGIGTTIGLVCLPFVFWPILGFGSAQYSAD
ncbi:MAG: hypothetical protein ACI9JK_000533 [Phycisphaerales bacterium]|jgi:hypothetical protein